MKKYSWTQALKEDAENLPPVHFRSVPDTEMNEEQLRWLARSLMRELDRERNFGLSLNPFN